MNPKHLLLAGLIGFVAGAHAATPFEKEAVHATWHAPSAPSDDPLGDLDPDPAFGLLDGTAYYYLDNAASMEEWSLRVFPRTDAPGWYVLGKHATGTGTWDAAVVVTGQDGAALRTVYVATPMFRLDDATLDTANGNFYFVGGAKRPGFADSEFAVTCVDISGPGGACAGFGNGGTTLIAFDRGGSKDDVARRVISRPNLGVLVAGWAKADTDRYVFVATALTRANGSVLPRFGTNGLFTADLGSTTTNLDVNVFDIALSNDPDSEARLYIAGNYSRNTARTDYDGVVLGLNAWNGVLDNWGPGGHGFAQVWLDLGVVDVDMSDAITAMRVLANGKLALAGWSKDQAGLNRMMLARLREDGVLDIDSGFCGSAGKCAPFGPGRSFWPAAVGERPDTRDLLVAAENPNNPGVDDETWQMVFRFDHDGSYRQSATHHSPHGDGVLEYTVPAAMLVERDSTMIVSTCRYASATNDYDLRLTRLLHNDTIFADTFGGAHAD